MNTCFSPKYESAIILNISIHFLSTQFQFNFHKPVKEWETGQSDHTLTPQVSRPDLGRFCQKSSLGVTITGQACRLWGTGGMGQPSGWECLLLFTHSAVSNFLWSHGLQHASLPCPSLSPKTCSNSCPLSRWCHPTISPSVITFSPCLQSFPASGSFLISRLFTFRWPKYCISASASVLPVTIQDWFPLGLTGLISLQCKGLSRVFSNTTVQKHQFFHAQPSFWSNSHIHTWLLEKP